MKIIKDPVHGYVEVSGDALALLDSPLIQRLRYVRQLGFSHLVYPGANHTRFEHSMGTMHLAQIFCRLLGLDAEQERLIAAAGLLHDIGHGPYSHATEQLMAEFCGHRHHEVEELIRANAVAGTLEGLGLDPGDVCAVIEGNHPLAGIIHGDLDVDRMDYLMRDAHYTGVPYGTVDAHRLMRSTSLTDHGLVVTESGINAAESLLIARTLMRPAVYFHHVSRIAERMIQFAAYEHLSRIGPEECGRMMRLDDAAFFSELLGSPSDTAREVTCMIYARRLYKRALYVGKDLVHVPSLMNLTGIAEGRTIAAEIADRAGIEAWQVLVDIPSFPSPMSMGVQVKNRHELVDLDEISPLVNTLNETRKQQWRMGIYTLPEHRHRVEEEATDVLHIKKPTKQDRLLV
ncbi:MAG: HD domain-containing protein [Methanomicrobiaceae archaeon]|nr:HD domain-containing protein [Methanomicrobiaceae archaeon]